MWCFIDKFDCLDRFWTSCGTAGESVYPYPQNGIHQWQILLVSLHHLNPFEININIFMLCIYFCCWCYRNSGQQSLRACQRCLSPWCFCLSHCFSFLCFFGICVSKYQPLMFSLCRWEHIICAAEAKVLCTYLYCIFYLYGIVPVLFHEFHEYVHFNGTI